jgi:hypothetical protein
LWALSPKGDPCSFALPQPGHSPRRWTTELEFDYLPPVLIILTHWLGFSTWVRSGMSLRIRVTPEVAVSHVYMGGTHVAALVPDPRLRACPAPGFSCPSFRGLWDRNCPRPCGTPQSGTALPFLKASQFHLMTRTTSETCRRVAAPVDPRAVMRTARSTCLKDHRCRLRVPSDPGAACPFGSSPRLKPVAEFGLLFKREPGSAAACALEPGDRLGNVRLVPE